MSKNIKLAADKHIYKRLVRLAHAHPELRADLLPLIKKARQSIEPAEKKPDPR